MVRTHLLLGSNKGDRQLYLDTAQMRIAELGTIAAKSSVYETAAWGNTDQPSFLNQVLALDTMLDPFALMRKLQAIETELGRVRAEKWGARTLDIDILLFGRIVIEHDDLMIPHPALPVRRFSLVPLAEIAPELIHPIERVSIAELLERCEDALEVIKVSGNA
ncbi:MAG: 2-amino-4-hydroxy-6-hydroxymethyldihydropteridine diphosphokinase [Bacteroidetes bacterium]|nr:2-amino-4-hydroxy-6-hydroxymethyldihydropteridine diphosphokinase [Bacteroidota bacterium]